MSWGPDHWSAVANTIIALSAAAAAFAAFKGLDTWRSQSIWHGDSDLARRLLIGLYRYRDSLYSIRHPAMSHQEMIIDDKSAEGLSKDEIRNRGVCLAYSRRWEKHASKRNELDALLIESDAVWGTDFSTMFLPIKRLEHELYVYIRLHLDAHFRGDPALQVEYRKIIASKRDILFDAMEDEDVYRKDFRNLVDPVEIYLRGKLGRLK